MTKTKITLKPLGIDAEVAPGVSLADALVAYGVEFPCGGQGRCRGCRVRVLEGKVGESEADVSRLSEAERLDGWRLACQLHPDSDLVIELRQWSGIILADETQFEFTPAEGLGVAVDVGTTTLVAQLLDLGSSQVLGTRTALNPQARHGADVMSRIRESLEPGALKKLSALVREQVAAMVRELLEQAGSVKPLVRGTLVGNTAMHHIFLGRDVSPLAGYPFEPRDPSGAELSMGELGWSGNAADARAHFLPVLGGFVGSDILAVILATRIHESEKVQGAADLGTNGEVVVGSRKRILVASTAAGPAFEGARISQGMRAAPGAIDRVTVSGGRLNVHVIGGGRAQGLCGSGLVDAVACALETGAIESSGRMKGADLALKGGVKLIQQDIRELQLAKGAIAAGISILLAGEGLPAGDVGDFYLAGAFGNNLSVSNTKKIGLFPFQSDSVRPVGNAALLGAKMALFMDLNRIDPIKKLVRHVNLEQAPDFQELFAESMRLGEKEE